jgi:catechol 2,3-dioxygenase-like lactoylglutathione lyase family enzyme
MTSSVRTRLIMATAGAALLIVPLSVGSITLSAQAPAAATSTRPLFSQGSMNVYRRFAPDVRARMIEFYEKALALRPLQPINLGGGQQMILFGIGTGQIKLASGLKQGRQYQGGAVNAATGIRVITLRFPDEAAVATRLQVLGYPAPTFKDTGHGTRAALMQDPGGFHVQLMIEPNASPAAYAGVEVGINVSNLERSRAFYREFVGLDELPAVKDNTLGVTKYPYRHGETTVSLWSVGSGLPADTGSAGIQYVVNDVDTVDARAKARTVAVEEPLSNLSGFSLRTVWLNDPDGVTNYFAQVGGARRNATP